MLRRLEMSGGHGWGRGGRGPRCKGPLRAEIVERLDREALLPAILFIFSRAGCDAAVQQCLAAGLRLTTPEERTEIRRVVESRITAIPGEDLSVLGYWEWLDGLERGLAAHHAGMLPAFKEVVEELFVRGLVKAVFATETLALGINMPARCVVLERLVKFNGEAHVDLTPGEYTQLTGRAGRRGIDVEGHAVVVWSPEVDPRARGRARVDPHLPAAVQLPAVVQHGRQPGRHGRRGPRPRAAGVLVRPVPGGPVGGRPGPAGAAQRGDDRGVRRPRRCATTATSTSTSRCGWRSPTGSAPWPARARRSGGRRRSRRWSGCGSAT